MTMKLFQNHLMGSGSAGQKHFPKFKNQIFVSVMKLHAGVCQVISLLNVRQQSYLLSVLTFYLGK